MKKKQSHARPRGGKVKSKKPKETTIVKRGWHIELYDEMKIYGSCVFACRMAHLSQKEAERVAEKVTPVVSKWVRSRKFVSSDDIYRFIIQELKKYDEDASFLYETHRDVS